MTNKIIRTYIFVALSALTIFSSSFTRAVAQDLQLFNPNVLGIQVSEPVKLLFDYKQSGISPISVQVDLKDGVYFDATVVYAKKLKFEYVRESLNKLYKRYEAKAFQDNSKIGLWRNENKRYAIQLSRDETTGEIVVIYVRFREADEILNSVKALNMSD